MTEPLRPDDAKRLIVSILDAGVVTFSAHAKREMAKDDLAALDCVNRSVAE